MQLNLFYYRILMTLFYKILYSYSIFIKILYFLYSILKIYITIFWQWETYTENEQQVFFYLKMSAI